MSYFSDSQQYLFPSSDISVEEKEKFQQFLLLLDESGVAEIITREEKDKSEGGRPSFNPYRLFAAIIYGFSKHTGSLRKLEESFKYDLRFIYLLNNETTTYVTISKFLNNVVVKHYREIFSKIVQTIVSKFNLNIDDVFIDGTKLEANANKYKFVWKPTATHKRLNEGIRSIVIKYFNLPDSKQTFISKEIANYLSELHKIIEKKNLSTVTGRGHKTEQIVKDYNSLNKCLIKCLEYEEKETICGPNRNSYFKTDKDATAMCLKEDFYSGLGSNMHAAYNLQIAVSKGLIIDFFVCQDRNDYYTLIPFLNLFKQDYGFFPKRLCCDSGYGSYDNYYFVKENGIGNYIKHQNWRQLVDGEYIELYDFDDEDNLICINNKKAITMDKYEGRHPHIKNAKFYKIESCRRCVYKEYCMRNIKDKTSQTRVFEVNSSSYRLKKEATSNLLSIKGIEMRINRSSQVEGAFGVIKQDMDYERVRRRGIENVSAEIMLVCLGYVIKKYFSLLNGKAKNDYWIAPDNLQPETIKNININKLLKKKHKGENKELRTSYKHKKSR